MVAGLSWYTTNQLVEKAGTFLVRFNGNCVKAFNLDEYTPQVFLLQ